MIKRLFFTLSILIIVSMLLSGCAKATEAPGEEPADTDVPVSTEKRTLVVAIPGGGVYEEGIIKGVVEPFNEKYPNVEVILTIPGNSSAILAKARAEKDNPTMDVVVIGGGLDAQGIREGLFQKLNYDNIPNINDIYDIAKPPVDGYGPTVAFSRCFLAYNTENVVPAPDSWHELWDPAHKDRIAAYNLDGTSGLMLLYLMSLENGGDLDNMQPGFDKMAELIDNGVIFTSKSAEISDMFAQDVIDVSVFWDGRVAGLYRGGFPVLGVCPKEGCFLSTNNYNVLVGSENLDLAEAFLNQWLDPESNGIWATVSGNGPVNKNTVLDEETAKLVSYGPEEVAKLIVLPWDEINERREGWIEYWNKEVLGKTD
jgi:putative spermidine/putrescine transport system substrate-binding protein